MRKTIAVAAATGALLFGGAGVAHATTSIVPAPSSTTTVAQEQEERESDKTGLWGLLGLLGLAGLAGLKRRDDAHRGTGTGTTGGGNLRT